MPELPVVFRLVTESGASFLLWYANWGADRKPMFGTCGLDEDEFLAVTSRLTDINKILKSGGFNFGYRLRNEICAFIANAKNIAVNFSDENTNSSAFDSIKNKSFKPN